MPKSKRDKKVTLSKTVKKVGLEFKQTLIDKIRQSVDDYSNLFVFSVENMRNNHLQEVREAWKSQDQKASFFLGKNRVMAVALGRNEAEDYNEDLHRVSQMLRGPNRGLMFTNADPMKVEEFFEDHSKPDYARTGGVATETVELKEGGLPQFGHAMEPQLRALGMPTTLKRGVIHLLKDYQVCKKGEKLSSEQARILKLFGYQQAHFQFTLLSLWTKDKEGNASFRVLVGEDVLGKENDESNKGGGDCGEDSEDMSDGV